MRFMILAMLEKDEQCVFVLRAMSLRDSEVFACICIQKSFCYTAERGFISSKIPLRIGLLFYFPSTLPVAVLLLAEVAGAKLFLAISSSGAAWRQD